MKFIFAARSQAFSMCSFHWSSWVPRLKMGDDKVLTILGQFIASAELTLMVFLTSVGVMAYLLS